MQISTPLKIPKIAQLQETIDFTCNPITNDNAHHELPKGIYNPKQDRKIWIAGEVSKETVVLRRWEV